MHLSKYYLFNLWNVILVGYVISDPDLYEVVKDGKKEYNLLDLLKDYDERDRGNSEYDEQRRDSTEMPIDPWTGTWLPHRSNEKPSPPKVLSSKKYNETENNESHRDDRVTMGVKSSACDDGKTNLTVDEDYSPVCFSFNRIPPNFTLPAEQMCEIIPKNYVALHKCMSDVIEYDEDVPLFGTHRPIWPVYGEYSYIPKQRWLHSLEHGAIVMLYHPCVDPNEVEMLKRIVKGCLRRHIITPYNLLDEKRPMALLSWGCILRMSHVNENIVINFIKDNATQGPEGNVFRDGEFDHQLEEKAKTVSDEKDSNLCPLNVTSLFHMI